MSVDNLVKAVLEQLKVALKTETVIGEPVSVDDDTKIIPVTKVSFGFGVGGHGKDQNKDFGGGTGGGATIEPVGFIVIRSDDIQLLTFKEKDNIWEMLLKNKNVTEFGKKFGFLVEKMAQKASKKNKDSSDEVKGNSSGEQ